MDTVTPPANDAAIDWPFLWSLAADGYALGIDSIHGPAHWQRVERNGLTIAATCGADVTIVRLFAVLHDSQRLNEGTDPEHGLRAANWAKHLRNVHFTLDDARFNQLTEACIWHDTGRVSDDATIGTCWDADRLDLPRVGIQPLSRFMSTVYGKSQAR
ncbi:hypothetical protein BH10PLA1_BH10PLA1_07760 [soil metagenome]